MDGDRRYLPGDVIHLESDEIKKIGRGLKYDELINENNKDESVTLRVVNSGKLLLKKKAGVIDNFGVGYIPNVGDRIIGVTTQTSHETVRVDIGWLTPMNLSLLAFDGASKRQKPNVNVGDLLYCQITEMYQNGYVELSCENAKDIKLESKLSGSLGVLTKLEQQVSSYLMRIPPRFAKKLLYRYDRSCDLLWRMAKELNIFESAIGVNGYIWFRANNVDNILKLTHATTLFMERGFNFNKSIIDQVIADTKSKFNI
ncbi:hypothetical protein SNEBB_006658 [Seison nebaliae]|nr:hypothetical protein SNEBB_006658 [Seison nebaliae]